VAAARKGTIGTQVEMPTGYFDAGFVPEKPARFSRPNLKKRRIAVFAPLLALMVLVMILTRVLRRRRR